LSKTYTFKDPYYTIEVPVTTAVCAVAIFYCGWHAIAGDLLSPALMLLFMVAAIYQVWNVLVSAAYPRQVVVDDESVSFVSMTRTDRYVTSEVKDMVIRGGMRNGRMFIRIDSPTIFRGRYWVNTEDFSDGEELRHYLLDLECQVNPNGLRARAMRSAQDEERRAALEAAGEVHAGRKAKKKRGGKKRAASLGTRADVRLDALGSAGSDASAPDAPAAPDASTSTASESDGSTQDKTDAKE
jgi:hypothetical protein